MNNGIEFRKENNFDWQNNTLSGNGQQRLKFQNNLIAKNISVARNKSLPPNAFRWLAMALLKGIEEDDEDSNQSFIERF